MGTSISACPSDILTSVRRPTNGISGSGHGSIVHALRRHSMHFQDVCTNLHFLHHFSIPAYFFSSYPPQPAQSAATKPWLWFVLFCWSILNIFFYKSIDIFTSSFQKCLFWILFICFSNYIIFFALYCSLDNLNTHSLCTLILVHIRCVAHKYFSFRGWFWVCEVWILWWTSHCGTEASSSWGTWGQSLCGDQGYAEYLLYSGAVVLRLLDAATL